MCLRSLGADLTGPALALALVLVLVLATSQLSLYLIDGAVASHVGKHVVFAAATLPVGRIVADRRGDETRMGNFNDEVCLGIV